MELMRGQKIKLTDMTLSSQIEIRTAVKMNNQEADISCFGVDGESRLSDDRYFIFYNQTSAPDQSIVMDDTGSDIGFSIDFKKLPSFVKRLVITVAADENATMRNVEKGSFSVLANGEKLADFSFSGSQFQEEKAVILCEIYEKDGVWRLSVVCSGFNGGLSALLQHFGGEEASGPEPGPVREVAKVPEVSKIPEPLKSPGMSNVPNPPIAPKVPVVPNASEVSAVPGASKPPEAPAAIKPVSLKKAGDSHKISLKKMSKEIHANLNWNTGGGAKGMFGSKPKGMDLDLACMYRLKTGEKGVVQALGRAFGSELFPPYIFLDKDDRTGVSQNGENMWFKRPETIEFAVVFAYIYEGVASWKKTDAVVVLKQQGEPDIEIQLENSKSQDRFCVIASLQATNDGLEVRREERYFKGHQSVDKAYGFGLRWTTGHK